MHLDWADFLAQAQDCPAVFVEGYQEPMHVQSIRVGVKNIIQAAYVDSSGILHAARLPVIEAPDTTPEERSAALDHATRALDLVRESLQQRALPVRAGLLLAPGLRDDLRTIQTHHYLWTWKHARNPEERRLIPA
jgi:hypothetical protein